MFVWKTEIFPHDDGGRENDDQPSNLGCPIAFEKNNNNQIESRKKKDLGSNNSMQFHSFKGPIAW